MRKLGIRVLPGPDICYGRQLVQLEGLMYCFVDHIHPVPTSHVEVALHSGRFVLVLASIIAVSRRYLWNLIIHVFDHKGSSPHSRMLTLSDSVLRSSVKNTLIESHTTHRNHVHRPPQHNRWANSDRLVKVPELSFDRLQ